MNKTEESKATEEEKNCELCGRLDVECVRNPCHFRNTPVDPRTPKQAPPINPYDFQAVMKAAGESRSTRVAYVLDLLKKGEWVDGHTDRVVGSVWDVEEVELRACLMRARQLFQEEPYPVVSFTSWIPGNPSARCPHCNRLQSQCVRFPCSIRLARRLDVVRGLQTRMAPVADAQSEPHPDQCEIDNPPPQYPSTQEERILFFRQTMAGLDQTPGVVSAFVLTMERVKLLSEKWNVSWREVFRCAYTALHQTQLTSKRLAASIFPLTSASERPPQTPQWRVSAIIELMLSGWFITGRTELVLSTEWAVDLATINNDVHSARMLLIHEKQQPPELDETLEADHHGQKIETQNERLEFIAGVLSKGGFRRGVTDYLLARSLGITARQLLESFNQVQTGSPTGFYPGKPLEPEKLNQVDDSGLGGFTRDSEAIEFSTDPPERMATHAQKQTIENLVEALARQTLKWPDGFTYSQAERSIRQLQRLYGTGLGLHIAEPAKLTGKPRLFYKGTPIGPIDQEKIARQLEKIQGRPIPIERSKTQVTMAPDGPTNAVKDVTLRIPIAGFHMAVELRLNVERVKTLLLAHDSEVNNGTRPFEALVQKTAFDFLQLLGLTVSELPRSR